MEDTGVHMFKNHWESGLFTIKLNFYDHLSHNFAKYQSLLILDAAPYAHFT